MNTADYLELAKKDACAHYMLCKYNSSLKLVIWPKHEPYWEIYVSPNLQHYIACNPPRAFKLGCLYLAAIEDVKYAWQFYKKAEDKRLAAEALKDLNTLFEEYKEELNLD